MMEEWKWASVNGPGWAFGSSQMNPCEIRSTSAHLKQWVDVSFRRMRTRCLVNPLMTSAYFRGHHKGDVTVSQRESIQRDEQREEPVAEVMEEVPGVPANSAGESCRTSQLGPIGPGFSFTSLTLFITNLSHFLG